MTQLQITAFGDPSVLRLNPSLDKVPAEGEVRVRICFAGVNPIDAKTRAGLGWAAAQNKDNLPWTPGYDVSGVVEKVGPGVTSLAEGDQVCGMVGFPLAAGAYAESVVAREEELVKLDGVSLRQGAALPLAGLTAWQALVDQGRLQVGQRVLINGSSGGVGHLAVQIAKELGAQVTAVCSSRNADFVRALGADEVLAYDQYPLADYTEQHDLVLDVHGNLRLQDFQRLGRRGVMVGFTSMGLMLSVVLQNLLTRYPLQVFTAAPNTKDLQRLAQLVQSEAIRVHIDKTFAAQQIPEAIAYIEAMRTRGKVAMVWEG